MAQLKKTLLCVTTLFKEHVLKNTRKKRVQKLEKTTKNILNSHPATELINNVTDR